MLSPIFFTWSASLTLAFPVSRTLLLLSLNTGKVGRACMRWCKLWTTGLIYTQCNSNKGGMSIGRKCLGYISHVYERPGGLYKATIPQTSTWMDSKLILLFFFYFLVFPLLVSVSWDFQGEKLVNSFYFFGKFTLLLIPFGLFYSPSCTQKWRQSL